MFLEVLKKPIHFKESLGPNAKIQIYEASFETPLDLKDLLLELNLLEEDPLFFFENKEGHQYLGLFPYELKEPYTLKENQFLFSLRTFEEAKSKVYWCEWQFKATPLANGHSKITITTTQKNSFLVLKELLQIQSQSQSKDLVLNLLEEVPQKDTWTTMVNKALEKLKEPKDSLTKVVLARKLKYHLSGINNERELFHLMANKASKDLFKILIKDGSQKLPYLSFTPESLHYFDQNVLHLEAIAGTRPCQENSPEQNEKWAHELINDPKEKEEHQAVVELLLKKARKIGTPIKSNTRILKLKGVQHLHTPIKVSLTEFQGPQKIIDIMDQLHPTPAICGSPTEIAKDFIRQNEGQRGLYAGLIGVHEAGRSESAVLIRGLETKRNKDNIELLSFGGAGIVKDSHPEKEWKETANKVRSFLSLISGPMNPNNLVQRFKHEIEEPPCHTKGVSLEN